tara:strand:- start:288 stop:620 length:333 start_codon:yes stop_codon:yes gene_type:complete
MNDDNVIDFESMKKRLDELEEYRRKVEAKQEEHDRELHNRRVQEQAAQNEAFEKLLNAYKVTLPSDANVNKMMGILADALEVSVQAMESYADILGQMAEQEGDEEEPGEE